MAGCGYVCPKCNDSGFDENMIVCDWCLVEDKITQVFKSNLASNEEWQKSVHEGPCCGDLGISSSK